MGQMLSNVPSNFKFYLGSERHLEYLSFPKLANSGSKRNYSYWKCPFTTVNKGQNVIRMKAIRKCLKCFHFSSVQFSHSVVSYSLWPNGLHHTSLPHPPIPGACSNSCPLSWWCYPTISFSVTPFSSCLQSFPAKSDRWIQGIIACLERNATWSHVNHDKWISKPEWTFKAF